MKRMEQKRHEYVIDVITSHILFFGEADNICHKETSIGLASLWCGDCVAIIVHVRVLMEMGNKPVSRDYQTEPNNATRNWDMSRTLAGLSNGDECVSPGTE